ncbi:hypothetical protein FQN57_001198 [Myotisia sp. PD_48]|nr:hypothetical protein FQN57_001198 [Myotisia sp. PD_48]
MAPPPRRQHEVPYSPAPPNVRLPGYPPYHHPHSHHPPGPIPPPYGPQNFQNWYPYQQMPPNPPPPQPYQQQPYTPLIVSSYPNTQHPSVPPLPPTLRTLSNTPPISQRSPFSATPPTSISTPTITEPQGSSSTRQSTTGPSSEGDELQRSPAATNASSRSTSPSTSRHSHSKPITKSLFQPPLPWLSVPEAPFPARLTRRRRKHRTPHPLSSLAVELPSKDNPDSPATEPSSNHIQEQISSDMQFQPTPEPATPFSNQRCASVATRTSVQQTSPGRPIAPVVPIIPLLPQTPTPTNSIHSPKTPKQNGDRSPGATKNPPGVPEHEQEASPTETATPSTRPAPERATPKSWADLVRSKTSSTGASAVINSHAVSSLSSARNDSLAEALNSFGADVEHYSGNVSFVEPRGLVNTGNMCYMNSILQVLIFCIPFYDFLDQVSRRAAHSFKSDIPLIDAMIMFMREFRVIDSASSVEQLRLRLKQNELEQYGDSFIPEYVYQVIRQLPRFRDMRRGHQQDAQEFLGFLLEELHEECLHTIKSAAEVSDVSSPTDPDSASIVDESVDGWLEVGHKQKAAITRSSGHVTTESPITRIFGGKLRSEFRVPGNKNSVTLEPYQSLQLDIGSPQVNNIIDALKGLTKQETMHGDFQSARGSKANATKQVFIENLPPVLVLHLKRFQYDSVTKGTQKIWKRIGYPLELEIPKEVFPPHRRNAMSAHNRNLPKYRLIGVIYHHGKNASGGHYTVEVRRQDGREWIRFDDTIIRRVRSEEVAHSGSEEDRKLISAALEQHNNNSSSANNRSNIYEQFDQDDQDSQDNDRGWSQVNGTGYGHSKQKSLAAITSGTASPTVSDLESGKRTPASRFSAKDNKVAYLLFYQRISGA